MRVGLVSLLCLALSASSPAATNREDPDERTALLRQAKLALQQDRAAEAEALLSRAWSSVEKSGARSPDFAAAVLEIAEFYRDAELWRESTRIFETGAGMASADDRRLAQLQILAGYGFAAMDTERQVRALAVFERARDLVEHDYGTKSPEAGIVYGLLAIVHFSLAEVDEADQFVDKMLAVNRVDREIAPVLLIFPMPSFDEFLTTACDVTAGMNTEAGRFTKAEAILRAGLKRASSIESKARMHRQLVELLNRAGRTEEARAEQQKILSMYESESNPEFAGEVERQRKIMDDLIPRQEAVREPPPPVHVLPAPPNDAQSRNPVTKALATADAAISRQDYRQAAAAVKSALSALPTLANREQILAGSEGILRSELSLAKTPARDDRVVEQLAASLDRDLGRKSHAEIARSLANYFSSTGEYAKAYRLLDRWSDSLRSRMGADAPELTAVYELAVQTKAGEGDSGGAIAAANDWVEFEQSVHGQYSPDVANARLSLAELYAAAGERSKASGMIESCLEAIERRYPASGTDVAERFHRAAQIYMQIKDPDRALEVNARILAMPGLPEELIRRAKETARAIEKSRNTPQSEP